MHGDLRWLDWLMTALYTAVYWVPGLVILIAVLVWWVKRK